MKAHRVLLIVLLLAPVAVATESSAETPAVLSLAPADALGVMYLAKPADVCAHPFWEITGAKGDPLVAELLETTATTFSGPTMIAVCGTPWSPMSIRVELAVQPRGGAHAFFEQLNEAWLPVMGNAAMSPAAGVDPYGDLLIFRLPGSLPIPMYAAQKEGLVYGSSRLGDVSAWLEGAEMSPRFVNGDDMKKLAADAVALSDLFGYFDARSVMPVAIAELDRLAPDLSSALGLEQLEFAALTMGWSRRNLDVQLSLGLAEGGGGAWDLLAPRSGPVEIASLIPADYTSFVRVALTDAAEAVDRVCRIVKRIDPDIVAEFEQECAEFRAEYGVDPFEDFAGNLVDEWMVAGRFDTEGEPSVVAAVRLADPAVFEQQAGKVIRGFDLEVDTTQRGVNVVYFASAETGLHIAWATVGDYLVMSNHPEPILEIAENAEKQTQEGSILDSPALRDVMQYLPAESAKLCFVSVAQLARIAAGELGNRPGFSDIADAFADLGETDAGVGLAVTRDKGALTAHLVASAAVNTEFRKLFLTTVGDSIGRARMLSKRVVSMSNIKGIITACLIHANDHKEVWPESLGVLIESCDILPNHLRSPLDDSREEITAANADWTSSYLYRPGNGLAVTDVVVCERELHGGGANFGFVDGHVEWIEEPRAQELLDSMKRATRR